MDATVKFQMVLSQVGRITLDQAGRRNALTVKMWQELGEAIDAAANDPDLKVLVITGAGEHFAAGADISEFAEIYGTPETTNVVSNLIADTINSLAQFPKPTIAKIRGACVGGGCGLALACDVRISDGTSKFGITPGKLGLVYPYSDITRLIQAVGISHAKDILFSARILEAPEALHIGLVNRVVDQYELDAVVSDYAVSVAALSGSSAESTKQLFMIYEAGQRGETVTTRDIYMNGFSSEDFKEGYTAFLEKRKPNFK